MSIEIVINATNEETRVAILENRTVTEFYIDRKKDRGIVGNVYKGKVVKVLPGMQAAFVDIGVEKAAFLYVSDVSSGVEDYEKYFLEERNKEGEETNGEEEPILPFSEEESDITSVSPEESADLQEEPENASEDVTSEVLPLDDPTPAETDFLTPRVFDETSSLAPAVLDEFLNPTDQNETNLSEAALVPEAAQPPVSLEVVMDPAPGEAKKETVVATGVQ